MRNYSRVNYLFGAFIFVVRLRHLAQSLGPLALMNWLSRVFLTTKVLHEKKLTRIHNSAFLLVQFLLMMWCWLSRRLLYLLFHALMNSSTSVRGPVQPLHKTFLWMNELWKKMRKKGWKKEITCWKFFSRLFSSFLIPFFPLLARLIVLCAQPFISIFQVSITLPIMRMPM